MRAGGPRDGRRRRSAARGAADWAAWAADWAAWAANLAAWAAVLAAWVAVAGVRPAAAEGLRRLDAGWLVPAQLATVAVDDTAGSRTDGAWVRAGQARLYSLPELPVRRLAAGLAGGGGAWALEAGWEAAGTALFGDDLWQGRLQVGRRLRAGVHGRWRRLGPGPGTRLQAQAWDLSLGWSAPAGPLGMCVATIQWPLLQSGDRALAPEPATRLLLAVASRGWAVALSVATAADGRPTGGWEALCGLGHGLGLSWRADPASGAMGAGLWWRWGRLRLRTSHLAHPELGLTHRFELALGAVGASPW